MDDRVGGSSVTPYSSLLETRWLATAPEVRHRRLDGALMSADLSGFTALSERLASRGKEGAERLTAMVNGCFTALIGAAAREGGDVLKFGGDALLIWFSDDECAIRAARAAARMQRAIGAARFTRAGLRMSVGVHAAELDFFLVGSEEWRELIVAGPPVSRAVDLEAAAEAGQVLVSPELAAALPSAWSGRPGTHGVPLALAEVPLPRRAVPHVEYQPLWRIPPRFREDEEALAGAGGEHRLASVVFAELEDTDERIATDVTGMAASLDDMVRAVEEKAHRYQLRFLYTDVISDGVKIICTAGAPTSTGQDEEAALRFATDLSAGDPKHRLRVGVNRGRVFAGFLGSETRRTYTVMGDPVNLAARLMTKAEPGQVIAADDVVRRSRATFRLAPLAPFLVKGKQQPVNAHVVGEVTGERQIQANSALPLVGRTAELAVLQDGIEAAATGTGTVVEITGDAGIGKSRLVEAASEDPRLVVRLATECQPYDALAPFASARTLLRRALGIPLTAPAGPAGRQLRATAERLAPDVVPMLPLLAVPLAADVLATPEADAVGEQFRAARMHEVVATLLAAALPQATLLVVEDIYYADDASLQLFRSLAQGAPARPWLMVVTRRPEGPGLIADQTSGTVLKLAALPEQESARLAELATGGAAVHPLEQQAITERAGGNPLFLLQLVSVTRDEPGELPESIERVVATRIDRLPPADRGLLRQAAVVGRVFHPAVLDALRAESGAPPVAAQSWDELADLVEPAGQDRWRFRHALFRDVAYEGLPYARRRRMHRAVGELLEAGVAGDPDAALLSEHFWLADDVERTWRYSVAAGDQAWAAFATTEAVAAYRRALRVRRRLVGVPADEVAATAESLGDALERAAQYDEADQAYVVARRALPNRADRVAAARLLRKRGELHERAGRYPAALRCYSTGINRLGNDPDSDEERTEVAAHLLAAAGVRHRQGRHHRSADLARRAIELAEGTSPRLVGHAESLLVVAATYGADVDGLAHGERAVRTFQTLGDALNLAKVSNNLGVLHYFAGRWTEAVACYQQSAEQYTLAGDVSGRAHIDNNLAEVLSDQGHLEAARDLLEGALRTWDASTFPFGVAFATANLGRLCERSGDWERARALLDDSRDRFTSLGASGLLAEVELRRVELELRTGGSPDALATITRLLEDTSMYPATRAGLLRCRGVALAQAGLGDEAREALADAIRYDEAESLGYEHALASAQLASVLQLQGDDGAADLQQSAATAMEGLGVVQVPPVPLPAQL